MATKDWGAHALSRLRGDEAAPTAQTRAAVGALADHITLDAPWSLQHASIGRIRGRRFVFDSDALDKLASSAWFSSRKIKSMLGLKPKWNLEKALPEMVAEMRSAPRS